LRPWREQKVASLSGAQVHTLLALQVWPLPQVPQEADRVAPQLSAAVTVPQFFPWRLQKVALLSGTQAHTLLAPQV
jgi:hypothetical protein